MVGVEVQKYVAIPLHRLLEMFAQKAIDLKMGEHEAYGEFIQIAEEIKHRFSELNEREKQLKKDKANLAKLLVNTSIVNIELMDTYIPQWRFEAKDNIEKLKLLLKS